MSNVYASYDLIEQSKRKNEKSLILTRKIKTQLESNIELEFDVRDRIRLDKIRLVLN